ncbi:hypothetical protein BGX23_009201 [Mortierella sp. AD031]|nr:hypothetical protein BGX23_009201 [Mortierella sp. AD031]KAG0218258.1 hypothetical protein BGX33_007936 [Mortierella sp. NVP41]
MSDSDDNRPVQKKKPQPRPRPKRSKLLSSPNSTLSSSRTDGSTTNSYLESERAADDFFSSISFTSISQYQETRRQEYEDLTKQDKNELDILDLEAPSIAVDVSPVQDLEDDAE